MIEALAGATLVRALGRASREELREDARGWWEDLRRFDVELAF
jgi:hypothetical protein